MHLLLWGFFLQSCSNSSLLGLSIFLCRLCSHLGLCKWCIFFFCLYISFLQNCSSSSSLLGICISFVWGCIGSSPLGASILCSSHHGFCKWCTFFFCLCLCRFFCSGLLRCVDCLICRIRSRSLGSYVWRVLLILLLNVCCCWLWCMLMCVGVG